MIAVQTADQVYYARAWQLHYHENRLLLVMDQDFPYEGDIAHDEGPADDPEWGRWGYRRLLQEGVQFMLLSHDEVEALFIGVDMDFIESLARDVREQRRYRREPVQESGNGEEA